jgi:DNA-binding Lrp family transcriptional regulator
MGMDDADLRIIEILAKNSRASFRKIAEETGLSTDTVMRRYQRLEKERQIQPTITVDSAKLGYEALAYFAVRVAAQNSLHKVIKEVSKIPDVTTIMKATGAYDLMLVACVRSIKHAFKIGEEIEATPDIRSVAIDLFLLPYQGDASFPPPGWHNLHTQTL